MVNKLPGIFVLSGCLLIGHPLALASSMPVALSFAQLPPKGQDSSQQMEYFNRELDRAEQLYNNLMFEEADRVADMTIARINAFLSKNRSLEGVDAIENVYQARVLQLKQLKKFKAAARAQMEAEGAANYDRKRAELERKRRDDREHQYRMAIEARRVAEARAAWWWSVWYRRPYSPVLIFY